jgi:predicted nucleotidyltransferase
VALFGSCAREEQGETSDVDVLVEVDRSIGLRFVELAERIEELRGIPADVISHQAIRPADSAIIEKELVDVASARSLLLEDIADRIDRIDRHIAGTDRQTFLSMRRQVTQRLAIWR